MLKRIDSCARTPRANKIFDLGPSISDLLLHCKIFKCLSRLVSLGRKGTRLFVYVQSCESNRGKDSASDFEGEPSDPGILGGRGGGDRRSDVIQEGRRPFSNRSTSQSDHRLESIRIEISPAVVCPPLHLQRSSYGDRVLKTFRESTALRERNFPLLPTCAPPSDSSGTRGKSVVPLVITSVSADAIDIQLARNISSRLEHCSNTSLVSAGSRIEGRVKVRRMHIHMPPVNYIRANARFAARSIGK